MVLNALFMVLEKIRENRNRHLFLLTSFLQDDRRRLNWLNNSVTFSGRPIGSEGFLNRMLETLGITIDRRLKGRPRKGEAKP